MLGLSPTPGLADILGSGIAAADTVQGTRVPNLFVLPCGMKDPDASEPLAPQRLAALLQTLGAWFDWVVFDTPPLGAVADASVLAPLVHHTLLVIRADSTAAGAARAAA